ncbi:hypothetical protein [Bacillus salipaludis]|uniref:Uncharacterized protein n=1 Tax=Bacillus salipaludis TaxID=2547811 RepID=A0AA90TVZ4_9BACI|nr:hypothetical protein [Bacillus salipaludis]MDQ6598423.1 hypothetical protein [Bacillus salipaludis]
MRIIAALFSIIMPGFGQFYNRQMIKGVLFVVFEHFDNMVGKINSAIQLDFNGFHQKALETVVYDGLLFYPGFYVYVVWDAWFYAKEGANKITSAIPFIIGGFLGELCTIFSAKLPFPSLTAGLLMVIPMVIGMVIF